MERTYPIYFETRDAANAAIKTYKDGQQIYIKNIADPTKWDIFTTKRTDSRKRFEIDLIQTGTTP